MITERWEYIPQSSSSASEYRKRLFPEFATNKKMVDFLRGKIVLDIGCGANLKHPFSLINIMSRNGSFTFIGIDPQLTSKLKLWEKIVTYGQMGIDISLALIEQIMQGNFDQISLSTSSENSFIQGRGESLPIPQGNVDIILSSFYFPMWAKDLWQTLQEMHRVLKPGGEIRLYPINTQEYTIFTDGNSRVGQFIKNNFTIEYFTDVEQYQMLQLWGGRQSMLKFIKR